MTIPLAATPDDVVIRVGGKQFSGWKTVAITRSCESMPNAWQVTASTEFMQGAALAGTRPGQACTILIGSDTVITGWIDRRSISASPNSHDVMLSGRGLTRNLVDCSADLANDPGLRGGMMTCTSALDLATRLSKAFKITCKSAVSDLGQPIPAFQVRLGETPYEVIETVARFCGYLVYEDETGALVLDRVGTKKMASGLTMPGNIEAINADRSVDQRYSQYLVVWYGVDQLVDLGGLANRRAISQDASLGEYRPKIIVSEQITPPTAATAAIVDSNAQARRRANWEMARRIGRSQAASIVVDSWRDKAGTLWTPNRLVTIDAPHADISNANWVIGSVSFRKDASGTHADLVVMPPEAFEVEPTTLNLFDAELTLSPKTNSPAPPSTSAGLGTPPT